MMWYTFKKTTFRRCIGSVCIITDNHSEAASSSECGQCRWKKKCRSGEIANIYYHTGTQHVNVNTRLTQNNVLREYSVWMYTFFNCSKTPLSLSGSFSLFSGTYNWKHFQTMWWFSSPVISTWLSVNCRWIYKNACSTLSKCWRLEFKRMQKIDWFYLQCPLTSLF